MKNPQYMGRHISRFDSLWVQGVCEPCSIPLILSTYSSGCWTAVKVHPKTLQRYARNGIVSGVRVGKLWRFRASELFPQSIEDHEDFLDHEAQAQ
jgi:hypothetical protein